MNQDSLSCGYDQRAQRVSKARSCDLNPDQLPEEPVALATDASVQRRLEMDAWKQDWQLAGQLLYGRSLQQQQEQVPAQWADETVETHIDPSSEALETTTELVDEATADEHLEEDDLQILPRRTIQVPLRRPSLRIRMKRGFSDGYVFALKTVAAVRRIPKEKDELARVNSVR